jgi:N-methylhydantoinase B
MAVVPVEVWETLTSTTLEYKQLLPDSAGPGAARGGLGQVFSMRNDTGSALTVFCMANRTEFEAVGFAGAGAGALRRVYRNDEVLDPKGRHVLAPGDRLIVYEAGGGGFGAPCARPREAVANDIAEGYLTEHSARERYGYVR